MTINKSQGQTLGRVGIYLPESVFTHGQLYVAFSRCGSPTAVKALVLNIEKAQEGFMMDDGSTIHSPQTAGPGVACFTHNVVYSEVLMRQFFFFF